MSILGIDIKENQFYVSYEDDCWVQLAKQIMIGYSELYANAIPTTAISQEEYDTLNKKSYAPIRRSILRNIKYGPVRHAVDMQAVYSGLEKSRRDRLKALGIRWKDNYNEDLTKL